MLSVNTDFTNAGGAESTPVLVDFDGDADHDLLVGAADGALRYWQHDGGSTLVRGSGAIALAVTVQLEQVAIRALPCLAVPVYSRSF